MSEIFTNTVEADKPIQKVAMTNPIAYNPDSEYQGLYRKWDDTVVGQKVNKFLEEIKTGKCEVDAKLYQFDDEFALNKQYTVVKAKTRESFVSKLKENYFDMGYENDSGMSSMNVTQEYLPLMGGPFYKQLYLYDYLDMHRKVFEAWNHNPVAHNIVKLTTNFVLGRGVKGVCANDELQKEWDLFWNMNKLDNKIKQLCSDLTIYGEIMVRCFAGAEGSLVIREIDPSTVWEIITEPDDIETVYFYHQQYSTAYQLYTPPDIPITKYIIRQIPDSEMIHKKINCVSNEKRGRSDLFSVLGWLKMLKDYYVARVVRAQVQCNFVNKVILKGSDADVANFKAQLTSPPEPNAWWVENESFTLTPMATTIGGQEGKDDGEMLLTLIATGVGIPKEFLGLSTSGSRATALVASEPSAKKFQERQALIEELLLEIFDKFLAALQANGKFTDLSEDEKKIEFTFPEIAMEDRDKKLKDLALAESMNWISKETAAGIAGKEFHISTYDYDEQKGQIAIETKEEIALAYAQTPKGIAPAGDTTPDVTPDEKKTDVTSADGKSNVKDQLGKL